MTHFMHKTGSKTYLCTAGEHYREWLPVQSSLLYHDMHRARFLWVAGGAVQAKGSMKMTRGAANGSEHVASGGEEVDMAAVLRMVYESAHMRSPSCTHAAVNALAEYAFGLLDVCCSLRLWIKHPHCSGCMDGLGPNQVQLCGAGIHSRCIELRASFHNITA